MAKKPEFNRVGASTYACTVCTNFKLEITKKMNAGELQRLLEQALVGQQAGVPDKPFDGSTAPPNGSAVMEPISRSRPDDEPNQPGERPFPAELPDPLGQRIEVRRSGATPCSGSLVFSFASFPGDPGGP